MIYNIQKFILFFLFSLLVLFYIIFSYYFFKQEEEVANVILKSLKNNITETSYTLSKNIEKKEDVFSYRALLDRITSNEDFIKAILVYDNEKLLLTTEPSIRTLDKNIENINLDSSYKKLIHQKYIEENIRFYEGKNQKTLLLVYIFRRGRDTLSFYKK